MNKGAMMRKEEAMMENHADDVVREDFAFTKASFASYDEREVTLCVQQRRQWKKRNERRNQADTLFSPATWLKASRHMEEVI